ncbi:MAG: pyridoxamine 5'-phosphate oxidase family protein [Emcibacteraceae bacterium]|nr:pyridoxamine 5'-phosphate oxidase family protein [Emcibacteraceae bacterium]
MGHQYTEIMFTDNVKDIQQQQGSRESYARFEDGDDYNNIIGPKEAEFIMERDSFYMASVSETGWPYVQHRGGPKGFIKILDESAIGFADFRGNKQYISAGNFKENDRVSLFLMDYKNRRRLKMAGRIALSDDSQIIDQMTVHDYKGKVDRVFVIKIEAFDWNCPQHITPRYTKEDLQPMMEHIEKLESVGAQS